MGEYVFYIIIVSVIFSFADFLVYDSEQMKSSRFCLGIILIAAMVSPLTNVLNNAFDMSIENKEDYENESQLAVNVAKKAFAEGIKSSLIDRFSLDEENIEIKISGTSISSSPRFTTNLM